MPCASTRRHWSRFSANRQQESSLRAPANHARRCTASKHLTCRPRNRLASTSRRRCSRSPTGWSNKGAFQVCCELKADPLCASIASKNKAIPALESPPVLIAPCSFEGDCRSRCLMTERGRRPSYWMPNGAPGGGEPLARARAPRDPHLLGTTLGPGSSARRRSDRKGCLKGASQTPWRLPALHPLVGETEKGKRRAPGVAK